MKLPVTDCSADQAFHRRVLRRTVALAGILTLVVAAFLIDLFTGPAALTPQAVLDALVRPGSVSSSQKLIVWTFRLPMAVMAIAVGASLGLAGGQMQAVLNNPLASPYTLGVSAAAGFGAALVIVFGVGRTGIASTLAVSMGAFTSAVACSLLLFFFCRIQRGSAETLLVGGVSLHFLFSSGLAFMEYMASSDGLNAIVFWTFGSLQGANWEKVGILSSIFLGVLCLIFPCAWQLTALQLGDEAALGLGIDVERLKLRIMLLVSILTATAVSFTGSIGFVGLVAPHLARMLVGADQRYLIVVSAGVGALLVSAAETLSKTLVPGTILPIGIITAAIGAPFFVGLALWSGRGRP